MEDSQKHKSFKEIAKQGEMKNRMQELADVKKQSIRNSSEIVFDILEELNKIRDMVKEKLGK